MPRFNRYGIASASNFSSSALRGALQQFLLHNPAQNDLDQLLAEWTKRALNYTYADDVSGIIFESDRRRYLALQPQHSLKTLEAQFDALLFDFWNYFTKVLYYNNFLLKKIEAHPQPREAMLNRISLLAPNIDQEKYASDFTAKSL